MIISVSRLCSVASELEFVVCWVKECCTREDEVENEDEFSSSEESAGVTV